MVKLTPGEQVKLTRIALARAGRRAVSSTLRLRPVRWLVGSAVADELVIVPQDLRTPDPSFLQEIQAGHFGLGGAVVDLAGHSPFALIPPNLAWRRELHGFGWLRDLRSAGAENGPELARRLARDWLSRFGRTFARENAPEVVGRRVISWLSHANLLLDGAEPAFYVALTDSLGAQIQYLGTSWRDAAAGQPRLLVLIALVLADLCVAGHERQLDGEQRAFREELDRQILPDGGHISRNPSVVAELLLDLLPLRQCYAARQRPPPAALVAAIRRMITFLKYMRRGDGSLARFNGMSRTEADALATVLAYDESPDQTLPFAAQSRYLRLQCADAVLLMDVGAPPPLEVAGQAHAGCLAFELSVGPRVLLANCGAPGPAHETLRAAARATASHNTLCLADKSSSRLVRSRLLEQIAGGMPVRLPNRVSARVTSEAGAKAVEASHDGYVRPFGLVHSRRIELSADGAIIRGRDQLASPRGTLRMRRDVPFAIHFHLGPGVACRAGETPETAILQSSGSPTWRITAGGARMSIETSLDYAHYSGPRETQQVVLRGACPGETVVDWTLERIRPRIVRQDARSKDHPQPAT